MTKSAQHSRAIAIWRRRMAGCLRVAGLLVLVGGALAYVSVRSAYAEAERSMRRLGQQLALELGPAIVGPPQELLINGQQLFISAKQSELSVAEVLDRLAASCASRAEAPRMPPPMQQPAPFEQVLLDLEQTEEREAAAQELPPLLRTLLHDPARLGVVRDERADAGHLACLAQPGRRALGAFLGRVTDFTASGDLSALGDVRYATAHTLENGKTHVFAVWSEGEFRLDSLFPASGDAPGSDLPDIPRPPSATRPLCVTALGRGFSLRLYDSAHPREDLLAFYERELPVQGWEPLPSMLEGQRLRDGTYVRAFTRNGQAVAIGVGATRDGKTGVSLVDLGVIARIAR